MAEQTRQTFGNLEKALSTKGAELVDKVKVWKCCLSLTAPHQIAALHAVYCTVHLCHVQQQCKAWQLPQVKVVA